MILQNKLGNSDINVSAIGLGCMSLQASDADLDKKLIQHAFEAGITHFDSADLYGFGANEMLLGDAVASFRNQITIATKVGNEWNESKTSWRWNVSKAYILKSIDDSLRRLKTDYIDLYQIHGGTIDDDFEAVNDTLEFLVAQGKIRSYGISSIRPNVFSKYINGSKIVSNMMQFSLLDTRPISYIPLFEKSNISIISRGCLAQGLLIDKPAKAYLSHELATVSGVQNSLTVLSEKLNVSKEAIALGFSLQQACIASTLVGVRTLAQLQSVIDAYQESYKLDLENIDIPFISYTEHLK